MALSNRKLKNGLIGIISTCILAYGLTFCKNPYVKKIDSDGKKIDIISLPANKGVYRGLFNAPIIYGGMDGDNTFYLYPSYDNPKKNPYSVAFRHIQYYGDEYDVLMVCRDSIKLRHEK